MIGAIVKGEIVVNLIVVATESIPEIERALNCQIVDAAPYGLQVGDLRTSNGWTRNAGGEQMILPLLEEENYDSYTLQQKQIIELEEAVKAANEQAAAASDEAAAEALAIMGLE